MRLALISPAVAAALAAAIFWTPLPHGLAGGDDDAAVSAPGRSAGETAVDPAAITPSHAATFVRFGAETVGGGAIAVPPPKPAPPALVGLIGSGPRRIAYVLIAGQTVRAGLWDKVGRWRLTAIGPRGVTLSAGRRSLALALYGPRPQPLTPPIPAASAEPADNAPPPAAPAPTAPRVHALEPASAPAPRAVGSHERYWSGPPGSAPPGYIVLKPGQLPPS
jgi:hypothetical protein